ncbi:MAG: hypothetical protein U0X74_00545 [Anaerolineales bacterium]
MSKSKKVPDSIINTKLAGKYTIWAAIIGAVIAGIFALIAVAIQVGWIDTESNDNFADTINNFKVVSQTKNELIIDVEYSYNPVYGERVYIGACLYESGQLVGDIPDSYGGWCGYEPSLVPATGNGVARVIIHPLLNKPSNSDEIEIFIYRQGDGETTIASRRFPFIQSWSP